MGRRSQANQPTSCRRVKVASEFGDGFRGNNGAASIQATSRLGWRRYGMTWKHSRSHMRNAPSMGPPNCFLGMRYKSRVLEGPRPQTVAESGISLSYALGCSWFGELVRALGFGVVGRRYSVAYASCPLEDEHQRYSAHRRPSGLKPGHRTLP
jgi:hypothetical protein